MVRYHKGTMRKLTNAHGRVFRQLFCINDKKYTIQKMVELGIEAVKIIVRKTWLVVYINIVQLVPMHLYVIW